MRARTFCDETGLRLHDDGILLVESDLLYATARRQSHHSPRHQHIVASGSCDAPSPAAESMYSRCPPRLHARRPDRLLQRMATLQDGLHQMRHVGSRTGLVEAYSNYSPFLSVIFTSCTRCCTCSMCTTAVRSDRVPGEVQKKLETQKRGPSGANWLRVEMPCRGN